jgi:hypothetical protein
MDSITAMVSLRWFFRAARECSRYDMASDLPASCPILLHTVRIRPAAARNAALEYDGKVTVECMYDIDLGDKLMFWMGIVTPQ